VASCILSLLPNLACHLLNLFLSHMLSRCIVLQLITLDAAIGGGDLALLSDALQLSQGFTMYCEVCD
jgi:hypothetical protein